MPPQIPDRSSFTTTDLVTDIWRVLRLPEDALKSVKLTGKGLGLPSSFKVGLLAQGSIAISALSAALLHSWRNQSRVFTTTVDLHHAVAEFKSERLYILDGKRNEDPWGPIGGLHQAADGYVRIHDGFTHHRDGALALLGLGSLATRQQVSAAVSKWHSKDLEDKAMRRNIVIAALRSYSEWDALTQAATISCFPVEIRKLREAPIGLPSSMAPGNDKCLRGLRVLELSRVIAAPIAGRTLAAHGAEVLWVTSPNLPDLPDIDCDLSRGKRTVHLDLKSRDDQQLLLNLAKEADVFIQGYRPGSIAALGLSPDDLLRVNPSIIYANMSAYGPSGPWSERRGFDSIVQTCSGMNVSEAEHFGAGQTARPMPCQALDHASGYLLATGIMAALYRRATEGGAYEVDVSLAGVMKYLRSLGQYPGRTGFDCKDLTTAEDVSEFSETRETGLGTLTAVRHSATIEGVEVGWEEMPKPLGSDIAAWSN